MTKNENVIVLVALGRIPRSRTEARICYECNRVVDGDEREQCGKPTWEFRSKYLRRFPRLASHSIPAHVINREYPYPRVRFYSGGQSERQ